MKVITLVTLIDRDKDGQAIVTPPGEVELDNTTARTLIARGQAIAMAKAREAAAREVSVHIGRDGSPPAGTP